MEEVVMKAFAGDIHLKRKIEELRDRFKIEVAVETGTHYGYTAEELGKMFKLVFTVEINPEYHKIGYERVKHYNNINAYPLDSVLFLERGKFNEPTLFYLDAHWENDWPLLREIRAIGKICAFPVIVIHDFKVDGLGYDTYNGQDLDFDYILPALKECYPNGFAYEHNQQAEAARRGVIFIYPKQ